MIAPPLEPSLVRNGPRGGARNYVPKNNRDRTRKKMWAGRRPRCVDFREKMHRCILTPKMGSSKRKKKLSESEQTTQTSRCPSFWRKRHGHRRRQHHRRRHRRRQIRRLQHRRRQHRPTPPAPTPPSPRRRQHRRRQHRHHQHRHRQHRRHQHRCHVPRRMLWTQHPTMPPDHSLHLSRPHVHTALGGRATITRSMLFLWMLLR